MDSPTDINWEGLHDMGERTYLKERYRKN